MTRSVTGQASLCRGQKSRGMRTGSRRNARIVSTYCIHSSPLFGFFGHQHIVWTYCNHSFALCGCWVTIEGLGAFEQFAKREVYIQISNSSIWDHMLHPVLKREDRLRKHQFAGFGTVMEDIKRTSYTKNQPILLGAFWENAFFVFLHYKIKQKTSQNTPKSDFRGPKVPPRGASSTWNM